MDFMEQEKDRGITIQSAATYVNWGYININGSKDNYVFNIIDTPGHVDFTMEVERSLRVLDGAICVLDGSKGPETQTMTVFRQAQRNNAVVIFFINKMDHHSANFSESIKQIQKKLHITPLALQIPIGCGSEFKSLIDVVHKKYLKWSGIIGDPYTIEEIPENLMDIYNEANDKLINELIMHCDEELATLIIERNATVEQIKQEIRKQTNNLQVFPTFCGSAYKNIGVETLLDGAVDYLLSPEEKEIRIVSNNQLLPCDPNGPLVALVFKLTEDKFAGYLNFIRIYSGTLEKGKEYEISRNKSRIKFTSICRVHAIERQRIDKAFAGDIVAITGDIDFQTARNSFKKHKH